MSSSLSSWFSSIRSSESENEIDPSLTSDIDSAFLSLDMNSSAFSISNESLLLPLGIGKSEITNRSSCAKRKMTVRGGGGGCAAQLLDGTAVMENTSPTILTTPCGHYLPTDSHIEGHQGQLVNLIDCADGFASLNASSCSMFQYILMAPTSPATKLNEETVTYLNQGHSYEIKLKKISSGGECEGYLYRSIVRVIFHERRLQFMEREQLESWRQTRPGERLMDIDIPLSYGLIDVRIDPQDLNCLEFVWDPRRDAGVFVKVHCISTEFTAKKHGGEKGVSFRVQLETYQHFMKMENYQENPKASRSPESQIMHCASCQVKVFKPKGADRKLKTDREKMDKKTESEKEKYQPPFEYTVMTDVPLDQVCFYLDQLNRQAAEKPRPPKLPLPPPPASTPSLGRSAASAAASSAAPGSSGCLSYGGGVAPSQFNAFFADASSGGGRSLSRQHSNNNGFVVDDIVSTQRQPTALIASSGGGDCGHGLVDSSSFEAARSPGTPSSTHSSASSSGGAFTGSFISALTTEAEVVAWLTANRFGHLLKKFQNFAGHDLLRLTRSDLIEICGTSDGIRLANSLAAKNIAPVITLYISSKPDNLRDVEQRMSGSCKENGAQNSKPNNGHSNSRSSNEQCLGQMTIGGGGGGGGNGFPYPDLDSSSSSSSSRRLISEALESAKRHLYSNDDDDEDNDEDDERKRAKRNCVCKTNTVYNAVYLSQATRQHLLEQVAAVAKLSLQNLRNFRMIMSSGVLVHITDSVVENLSNESKFFYEIISDGSNFGWDFILTPINYSSK